MRKKKKQFRIFYKFQNYKYPNIYIYINEENINDGDIIKEKFLIFK